VVSVAFTVVNDLCESSVLHVGQRSPEGCCDNVRSSSGRGRRMLVMCAAGVIGGWVFRWPLFANSDGAGLVSPPRAPGPDCAVTHGPHCDARYHNNKSSHSAIIT
jgi:hypothetical protein